MEIKVQKLHRIPEDKHEEVLAIIKERERYYQKLFFHDTHAPQITLTFEGTQPLTVRIVFVPYTGRRVAISVVGYDDVCSLTKHACKKLRRVAKNHFVKHKHHHRR